MKLTKVIAALIYIFLPLLAFAQNDPWQASTNTSELLRQEPFADGVIQRAYCDILSMVQGGFGALLLTACAVVTLVLAAMGNRKHAYALLITGIGAATIKTSISLFFGDFNCGG